MITNDLQYYQSGSNSSVLGIIDPNAAAPVVNAQATAQSDRVVMLRSVFLEAANAAGAAQGGSVTNFFVQSWDLNWSDQGFPLAAFGQNSGISRYLDVICGLWVSQQVDIRVTMDAAAVLRGSIGVDDLEGDARWRQLVDSLRRSNVAPGRIGWLFGCGVNAIPAGATVNFTGTAARPGMGPGMPVVATGSAHAQGELEITDIRINNISQLPSLNQAIPFEALEPANYNRQGICIAKPLDLATPVTIAIRNNTGAPIANVHAGFVCPPAFAIAELSSSYASLPSSEKAALDKMGASPKQLLAAG